MVKKVVGSIPTWEFACSPSACVAPLQVFQSKDIHIQVNDNFTASGVVNVDGCYAELATCPGSACLPAFTPVYRRDPDKQ